MKSLSFLALSLAAGLLLADQADAKTYHLCVTCSDGSVWLVGSPTTTLNGAAQCASKGAGTATNVSPAYQLKTMFGVVKERWTCPKKAVKPLFGATKVFKE